MSHTTCVHNGYTKYDTVCRCDSEKTNLSSFCYMIDDLANVYTQPYLQPAIARRNLFGETVEEDDDGEHDEKGEEVTDAEDVGNGPEPELVAVDTRQAFEIDFTVSKKRPECISCIHYILITKCESVTNACLEDIPGIDEHV